MILSRILLSCFRSYETGDFSFSPKTTVIIGHNTAGKSNLIEAISLLSLGKSFRAETPLQLIKFGNTLSRVKGKVIKREEETVLEYTVVSETPVLHIEEEVQTIKQQYRVNDVPKRRSDFSHHLYTLLFLPSHLDLLTGGPSFRREYLNEILSMSDQTYDRSLLQYEKALKQRNALLKRAKETGIREEKEFAYWDNLLIYHGSYLQHQREKYIEYLNEDQKLFLPFTVEYDKSEISQERLLKYQDAERGSGVTLVGPHRDDIKVYLGEKEEISKKEAKQFASRGQQRLIVLNLKMTQMDYLEKEQQIRPILLLDDIFSELDDEHIQQVLELVGKQQTIITTTHKEFVSHFEGKEMVTIELS